MGRYAVQTGVSVERSQEQIKNTLRRYGADGFGLMERRGEGAVMFEFEGLSVRLAVPLPSVDEFCETATGVRRGREAAERACEAAIRQRWRALLLGIKAKLEADRENVDLGALNP